MFNLGPTELIVLLLIILLLFGARKVPELASSLGRSVSQFRKGMKEEPSDGGATRDE